MKDQLIEFETAKLAKEKGFDELIMTLYVCDPTVRLAKANNSGRTNSNYIERENYLVYSAPTQSILQRWLRENHNLYIDIHSGHYAWNNKVSFYTSIKNIYKGKDKHYKYRTKDVSTYEEALEKGLQEALNLMI